MRRTVHARGKRGRRGVVRARFKEWFAVRTGAALVPPQSMQVSTIAVGRDAGEPRTAVRPSGSDHRMSGLIGRLISHLAQKYIVEALGSTSALSEP